MTTKKSDLKKKETPFLFGPVPSRRLGRSLGINNIPPKQCCYACCYCQVGYYTGTKTERDGYYRPAEIIAAVERKLRDGGIKEIDYLTVVPDGEPTLDRRLGELIRGLAGYGIPVAVITNGSLLWDEEVREELSAADYISVKIDSVDDSRWRKINRPNRTLTLPAVLEGIQMLRETFSGTFVTETMLVRGVDDDETSLRRTADFIGRLEPDTAYISVPTRPPALDWVRKPGPAALNNAFQIFQSAVRHTEYLISYEGNDFSGSGTPAEELSSITAVHPMREEAVEHFLDQSHADWDLVSALIHDGVLKKVMYDKTAFYVRNFS